MSRSSVRIVHAVAITLHATQLHKVLKHCCTTFPYSYTQHKPNCSDL